ncbi:anhydro-N-acetylmuramic acid kinase [Sphingomonas aerophila]|uniref:Anhydro-N-acetylmuramic acid kinase n=1 Tax=Sphingomonas aerophila TaxID=1344948 RepID=A0A7W9ESK2_9SPHN|nr:anhydro-N-acetylmuramic acid kinase [Sphingomonas aerophila]MBB5713211.1 anhydro-N-acetylmuramic acid kinase [Sphingomonas aerophila]
MRVLGFMSGTSLDGVDAAIIETDGVTVIEFGPALLLPFTTEERSILVSATEDAVLRDGRGETPAVSGAAAQVVLDAHVRAAEQLRAEDGGDLDLVGFHGQTVLHRPERRLTIQLGDPSALADALGVPVVANLRQMDLAAGGQGAPIVPAYHAALADRIGAERPIAFLNLGGVANLTWLGRDGEMIAFDTGPANGLVDLAVQARGLGRYDDGGRYAAAGHVDAGALSSLLNSPYFHRAGAKSLDRYDFSLDAVTSLSIEDAAATLTAFTAETVGLAADQLPSAPGRWVICGGGRHNPTMMRALADRVGRCDTADALGLRGDFIEAEAIAFLAARSVAGLPITFPGTTGVPHPMTGGERFGISQEKTA